MICVDPLQSRDETGKFATSCHLFADDGNMDELHEFAQAIGLRRWWFQCSANYPHYDLTGYMRKKAIRNGAQEVGRRHIVESVVVK